MYSCRQLFQHEAAGHPADIGQRVIAQKRGGQDDVGQRIPEHVPLPGEDRIDQDHAGDRGHHALVEDADPARAADPAENAVEYQKPDEAEPEDRHRVADQRHDAGDLVDPAAATDRGDDAQRDPDHDTDQRSQRGKFKRRGEDPADVVDHRVRGQERDAEIAVNHVAQVIEKLHQDRLVEAHLVKDRVIGLFGGALADHGKHGVLRHQPANDEGHEQKAQHRHENRADAEACLLGKGDQSRRVPAPTVFRVRN